MASAAHAHVGSRLRIINDDIIAWERVVAECGFRPHAVRVCHIQEILCAGGGSMPLGGACTGLGIDLLPDRDGGGRRICHSVLISLLHYQLQPKPQH